MKIKYRKKTLTLDEQINLISDYNAGMPVKEIEARYGVSRTTIYNVLRKEIN
jgi:Mor family transcriptional regulator